MNILIATVGLCGSGKSEAASILEKKGFSLVTVSGEITDELKKKGFRISDLSKKRQRDDLRTLYGDDALVSLLFGKIDSELERTSVVIDGMYSWNEYLSLRERYGERLKVLALFCPKDERYSRLERRKERPIVKKIAEERDMSEIASLNKGGPIAIADFTIINDSSIKELEQNIDRLLDIDGWS